MEKIAVEKYEWKITRKGDIWRKVHYYIYVRERQWVCVCVCLSRVVRGSKAITLSAADFQVNSRLSRASVASKHKYTYRTTNTHTHTHRYMQECCVLACCLLLSSNYLCGDVSYGEYDFEWHCLCIINIYIYVSLCVLVCHCLYDKFMLHVNLR